MVDGIWGVYYQVGRTPGVVGNEAKVLRRLKKYIVKNGKIPSEGSLRLYSEDVGEIFVGGSGRISYICISGCAVVSREALQQ